MSQEQLNTRLNELRDEIAKVNEDILAALNERFRIALEIAPIKQEMGLELYDPVRESEMLAHLQEINQGPMSSDMLKRLFKEVFKAALEEMGVDLKKKLKVHRLPGAEDSVITVRGATIGGPEKVVMAGPCSVESQEQMHATAKRLSQFGVKFLRGGAFKPRTSPYSFQGLEEEGLKIMREAADEFDMAVVTEVLSVKDVELVARYADILQVGTRNMFNYTLLKELGKVGKPIFLKRGLMAKIDEFIMAAEYIYVAGNHEIIMCERGIRTYETQTRNTLDLSAVPIIKKETTLPIVVDASHALGRKDILKPMCAASIAAGADGLMLECHYNPQAALSDCAQQLDPDEMDDMFAFLKTIL
jgi:3-deoxy-7-phosphoheptulonate synthase/chorismate mutase